ncbi:MAG TPA: serine/threonine-protein kinase [Verrucomicrobiae bacterium]|nr:serine/threonine-protein kinase [Verrucomicrobiae bacterium]
MIGSTFADFTVLDKINKGGMATIYLVADRQGQRLILRMLLPEHRFHWSRLRQFKWGCQVMEHLDHPNIVRYYGSGKFNSLRYAIIEYIEGPNLKEAILRNDPGLRSNQRMMLTGMAAALAHVHDRGFLHLDFKPENVLVPKTYEAKLIDFDLSIPRPVKPRREPKLSGTPFYLAPEQLARQPVDERADIFAFGITAYEMITGKKPISGDTREEILQKYANFNEHLRTPRALIPDIPHSIERVILKCLEKNPADRYPAMSLVVRDLQI